MTDLDMNGLEAAKARLEELAGMKSIPSVLTRSGREFIAEKAIRAYLSAVTPTNGDDLVERINAHLAANHEAPALSDRLHREAAARILALTADISLLIDAKRDADEQAAIDYSEIERQAIAAEARLKVIQEALKPSGETKAAYMGEFTIAIERHVSEDCEVDDEAEGAPDPYEHITVPWTTIKEIMAAVSERARKALEPSEAGGDKPA